MYAFAAVIVTASEIMLVIVSGNVCASGTARVGVRARVRVSVRAGANAGARVGHSLNASHCHF